MVEYPTGVRAEELAVQSVEMNVFGGVERRYVKTFMGTELGIASRFAVVKVYTELVGIEVQRQFRFLGLIFCLVGEVEVVAQEQPSIAEVKTYFRTQIRSEFQTLVAGFGTDFKILLPCTLLQTENQVVLVGSNVVGVDRIDKLEFPFFLCRDALVFFLCLHS